MPPGPLQTSTTRSPRPQFVPGRTPPSPAAARCRCRHWGAPPESDTAQTSPAPACKGGQGKGAAVIWNCWDLCLRFHVEMGSETRSRLHFHRHGSGSSHVGAAMRTMTHITSPIRQRQMTHHMSPIWQQANDLPHITDLADANDSPHVTDLAAGSHHHVCHGGRHLLPLVQQQAGQRGPRRWAESSGGGCNMQSSARAELYIGATTTHAVPRQHKHLVLPPAAPHLPTHPHPSAHATPSAATAYPHAHALCAHACARPPYSPARPPAHTEQRKTGGTMPLTACAMSSRR